MATEQEEFWQGEFGDEYVIRNGASNPHAVAARIGIFSRIISQMYGLKSVYEIGTNVGLNLDAFRVLLPDLLTNGCEINQSAYEKAVAKGHNVQNSSVFDVLPEKQYDLVFTSGVMIHIDPSMLIKLYDLMGAMSSRYILLYEYFSPYPVEVKYRGHSGKLFKRDFAKEIMDHCGLEVVDYGFIWRHDKVFTSDDSTWFLLEKR